MTSNNLGYVLSHREGKSIWFLGTLMTLLATGEDTQGAFGLIEQVLPPGFAPPPHMHHAEDEAFYLLEGEITFRCGNRSLHGAPGSLVFLPRGIVHSFNVAESGTARLIQLNVPAGLEHFFEEMGEPTEEKSLPPPPAGPPDIEKLVTLSKKYNLEIQGLPPGQANG